MKKKLYIVLITLVLIGCSDFYPLYFDGGTVVVELTPPQDTTSFPDSLIHHNIHDTIVIWQADFRQPHNIFMEFSLPQDVLGDATVSFFGNVSSQMQFEFGLLNLESESFEGNIVYNATSDSVESEYIIMRTLSASSYRLEATNTNFQQSGSVAFWFYVGYDSDDSISLDIAQLNSLYSTFRISSNDSLVMEPGSSYFSHFYTQPGDSIFGYVAYSDTLVSSWIITENEFNSWIAGFKEQPPANYQYFNRVDGDTLSLVSNSEERFYFVVNNDSSDSSVVISDFVMLKRIFR